MRLCGLLLGALLVATLGSGGGVAVAPSGSPALFFATRLSYQVEASSPRVNRRLSGTVTREVQGVPAEPVDSFVWNGIGSTKTTGTLTMQVDPVQDAGRVSASWVDAHGQWTLRQRVFLAPEHPAGVRIGRATDERVELAEGVVHNAYLFGDTGAGGPVLPTMFSHVAAFGPAEVSLNGLPFRNPFDASGEWIARTIVSEGVRQVDGTVRALGGVLFDSTKAAAGKVDVGDLEVHLLFHDRPLPLSANLPAEFEFLYHVVFEDVTLDLVGVEGPGDPLPVPDGSLLGDRGAGATGAPAPARYQVAARSPRRNRRVIGPVTLAVQGVPAMPVDSFTWNGNGSVPVDGELLLEVVPDEELGLIQATWTDEHGEWRYVQTRFIHPEHSSGVRIGPSVGEIFSTINEGITNNVYLHGNTTAGMPVVPTLFNHIATWGPADVWLDGEPFLNPFELPGPQWIGHLMVTEGVRQADGTVRTRDGGIYNPTKWMDGAVQTEDLEVHLVFHDERFPRNDNIPPLFDFFYHLVFEEVSVRIVGGEAP